MNNRQIQISMHHGNQLTSVPSPVAASYIEEPSEATSSSSSSSTTQCGLWCSMATEHVLGSGLAGVVFDDATNIDNKATFVVKRFMNRDWYTKEFRNHDAIRQLPSDIRKWFLLYDRRCDVHCTLRLNRLERRLEEDFNAGKQALSLDDLLHLAKVVSVMHSHKISHGDFKAKNIMREKDNTVKIIDLNLCKTDASNLEMVDDCKKFLFLAMQCLHKIPYIRLKGSQYRLTVINPETEDINKEILERDPVFTEIWRERNQIGENINYKQMMALVERYIRTVSFSNNTSTHDLLPSSVPGNTVLNAHDLLTEREREIFFRENVDRNDNLWDAEVSLENIPEEDMEIITFFKENGHKVRHFLDAKRQLQALSGDNVSPGLRIVFYPSLKGVNCLNFLIKYNDIFYTGQFRRTNDGFILVGSGNTVVFPIVVGAGKFLDYFTNSAKRELFFEAMKKIAVHSGYTFMYKAGNEYIVVGSSDHDYYSVVAEAHFAVRKNLLKNIIRNSPRKLVPISSSSTSSSLIDQVIQEAGKKFVRGMDCNAKLIAAMKTDSELAKKLRLGKKYVQYVDECFPAWNANRLVGTNFIASHGPWTTTDVGRLIENTVFNPHLPIRHIIALGAMLADDENQDFYDYCVHERTISFGSYPATIKRISGSATIGNENQVYPNGIIQSQLFIGDHVLNITLITIVDNQTLYLGGGEKELLERTDSLQPFEESCDERKELLWQIYQLSLREPILVHCAAGIGRTGHIILTLEILKYYDRLFTSKDPERIANGIHEILDRLRLNRPAFVFTLTQFADSIRNAEIIHSYALKKGYIRENSVSAIGMFAADKMILKPAPDCYLARAGKGNKCTVYLG